MQFWSMTVRAIIPLLMALPSDNNRNWYLNFGHRCLINDLGISPQPSGFALGLWWASQVVNETTMTSILVSISIIIIGSDNVSCERRQAIIWTNAGMMFIGSLETYFREILIEMHTSLFNKMHLNMSCGKCWPPCLSLNVLRPRERNHGAKWTKSINTKRYRQMSSKSSIRRTSTQIIYALLQGSV